MSKQLSRAQIDAIIFKAGIGHRHHDEVREALGGKLYSGDFEGSLKRRLLQLQGSRGGYAITENQRHAIEEAVFGD